MHSALPCCGGRPRAFSPGWIGTREAEYEEFCAEKAAWLEDYALFMAFKDAHGGIAWTEWEPELAGREPAALAAVEREARGRDCGI